MLYQKTEIEEYTVKRIITVGISKGWDNSDIHAPLDSLHKEDVEYVVQCVLDDLSNSGSSEDEQLFFEEQEPELWEALMDEIQELPARFLTTDHDISNIYITAHYTSDVMY